MFNQVFGNYLVDEKYVTQSELDDILERQQTERVKLGTIAVAEGFMTSQQVEEINHLQVQMDKRFGDLAIEQKYLTEDQLVVLLSKQGSSYMKFLQILMEELQFSMERIEELTQDFKKEYGFSDEEIKALKEDDFDNIVPAFVYASKPYVTELVALVLRSMVRFVTSDFYIGNVKHVQGFEYKSIVGQRLTGEQEITLAFTGVDDNEGIKELAAGFSDTPAEDLGNEMYDAIGEFTNICNGLLATELSARKVTIDMEPPFVYLNQHVTGDSYLIPLFIHGKEVRIFISVNSDTIVGTEPFHLQVEKMKEAVVSEGAKTVVIVDDSVFIRKTLRSIVEDMGYIVVAEAVNGIEGVVAYKQYHPDVLTLDITMPVQDGIEALKEIMAYDKKARVIMVTAAGQQSKVIEALKLGAEKFVMKPFDIEELKKALQV
jgi:CheY-like chemotaxis protein/CheY-specific phosphatase CheX